MPFKIGNVTLQKIMLNSVEVKKVMVNSTIVYEVVSNYTVTFVANNSTYSTKTVTAGGTTSLPTPNPTRSGWTFNKWVYGSSHTQFTSSTVVNANMTVTSYWYKYDIVGTDTCYKCSGSGYAYNWESCEVCYGLGNLGEECPECNGYGCDYCNYSGFAPCMTCDGNGGYFIYGTCDVCYGSGVSDVYDDVYEAY